MNDPIHKQGGTKFEDNNYEAGRFVIGSLSFLGQLPGYFL